MSTKTTQEIMKHCMHIPKPFIHLPFVFETEMRRNTFFFSSIFEVVPGNVNKSFKHFDILKYTVTLVFFLINTLFTVCVNLNTLKNIAGKMCLEVFNILSLKFPLGLMNFVRQL